MGPALLAAAVSMRVDIFKLQQPDEPDEDCILDPKHTFSRFDDHVTSVQFRQDGGLLLTGEKSGRIQLHELKNKFVLRTYAEFTK